MRRNSCFLLPLLVLLAAFSLPGCAALETDPILARLERSKRNAKPLPTPAYRMSPAEAYPDNPQAQALVKAAIKGDVKEIDRLVDGGADPNAEGAYGITVPGWVIFNPNKAGFRRLLERGADPNKIWRYRDRSQRSLMHLAAERSPEVGVDYLRMCLEIGKGDPNLEPPDQRYRVIAEAVQPGREAAFALLYKAGAQIDYRVEPGFGGYSLIQRAANSGNYKLTLFMLEHGVYYLHTGTRGVKSIQDSMQIVLERATLPREPTLPDYIWFWRCVDWLERHGMKFDYTPAGNRKPAVKPAVLDTTPPDILSVPAAKTAEPPKDIRMLMHQVHLTFPLPFWADTPEASENVQARQTLKPGIITLDYLPKDQTEADWKTIYTASTTYTPRTTLDETLRLVQKTLHSGFGADATITSEESAADHHILRFAIADASHTEGVLYLGRFMDTIVTVRAIWRNVDAATASAYRAKALSGMRQVVMKKGLTVLPAH